MTLWPTSPAPAATAAGPQLRDIHMPAQPPWWPPAPGWWIVAGLILLGLLLVAWVELRRRRKAHRRARIVGELDLLLLQYQRDGDSSALASGMHTLVRRVARRQYPLAAQQQGAAWRKTLARVPVDESVLDQLVGLDQAMYRPPSSFDHEVAAAAVRQWLQLALKPGAWRAVTEEKHD